MSSSDYNDKSKLIVRLIEYLRKCVDTVDESHYIIYFFIANFIVIIANEINK